MKCSIIIRAYNAENTIKRAIESAVRQNFSKNEFEVIVVNDGSTDKTREAIDGFSSVPNLKIIDQKNGGPARAANCGFQESRGKYVVLLDSDDTFESNLLKEEIKTLESLPEFDFVYSDYYEEDDGVRKIVFVKNLFQTVAGGILFRRDRFKAVHFFSEQVKFIEYDLLLRTSKMWRGFHIAKPLLTYMRRDDSLSKKRHWQEEAIKELLMRYPDRKEDVAKIRHY